MPENPEIAAMRTAYLALTQLDEARRRRAMWGWCRGSPPSRWPRRSAQPDDLEAEAYWWRRSCLADDSEATDAHAAPCGT